MVSDYDVDAWPRIVHWPLREVLEAYQAKLRLSALQDWRFRVLVWAVQTQFAKSRSQPPAPPAILGALDDDA